jgi:hypothetical protein
MPPAGSFLLRIVSANDEGINAVAYLDAENTIAFRMNPAKIAAWCAGLAVAKAAWRQNCKP